MAVDSEHAVEILSGIFANGVDRDSITFIAGVGGQRILINRAVLMANSKYFTASLGSNFIEANENEFILEEIDGSTLKAIVDFCYTGRIDLTEENASKYLAIASSVELRLLERRCFGFFAEKLNINRAVTTLAISDKYNGRVLRQKAFDLVCELFDKLPSSHIDALDSRLLEEILKSDALYAEERIIFERLLCWYRKDDKERRQQMTDFLKLIRLPLIPTQYLDSNNMQMIYKELGRLEYLNVECKRRIACSTSDAGIRRRRRSVYCLFKQHEGDAGAQQSVVKPERYISTFNEFEGAGEIELGQRKHFGVTLHEHKVYIIGGQIGCVYQKSVSVFDLNSGEERVLPEMASARSHFASILVGKFIYVFGGFEGAPGERFDLEVEKWETLKPMNVARMTAAVAVINGYICVAGGFGYLLFNHLNDVELFDPQNGEWTTLPPMHDKRARFTICNLKGYLYAMGESSSIERYDPLMNRWTKIGSCKSYECITSSVVVNDTVYAIRGDDECGEMKIDGNGVCSFIPLAKSMFSANSLWRHDLFCNY